MKFLTILAAVDPAAQQALLSLQKHMAVSVYAALIFAASFPLLGLVTILTALRFNRTALSFLALYAFLTFWIPSGPTLIFCPVIFLASTAGIIWLSLVSPKPSR